MQESERLSAAHVRERPARDGEPTSRAELRQKIRAAVHGVDAIVSKALMHSGLDAGGVARKEEIRSTMVYEFVIVLIRRSNVAAYSSRSRIKRS